MRLVILESPYAGDIETNTRYARAAMRDCLERNEAPFASHLFYTQVLDDGDSAQRMLGMKAGFAWGETVGADVVVYRDLGVSPGMRYGIALALSAGRRVEYRELGGEWKR